MGDKTKIEWSDATWNPVTGCDRCSAGCDFCYALPAAARLKAMGQANYQKDGDPRTSGPGFGVTCHPHMLDIPLRWKKPRRIFVNSMSDLFHPDVPSDFIAQVFAVMACAPQHTFQILTKRPQRMEDLLRHDYVAEEGRAFTTIVHDVIEEQLGHREACYDTWPLPNVWLGVSIENDTYSWRANYLRNTPAAVRFISAEPLLGPLPSLDLTGIDWLIVGGESGPSARPMHPAWVRILRDRCDCTGGTDCRADNHRHGCFRSGFDDEHTAFFFKQWGEWQGFQPDQYPVGVELAAGTGKVHKDWKRPDGTRDGFTSVCVGKKAAGRELDGRTWNEMPEVHQ